jgi:aldehyde:ferredoxin oxidoreductase
LGRLINPETAGKKRNQLTRAIVLALRELMGQPEPNATTRDIAAFIALALEAIAETIDSSVIAWEKRGYWVKADRFRMEWAWADPLSKSMRQAVTGEDWSGVARISAQVAQKLKGVNLPQRHRLGTPWEGAWLRLQDGK